MTFEEVVVGLGGTPSNKKSVMVYCPTHNDHTRSLHVSQKGNKILLHDHGGCDTERILAHMGWSEKDLFVEPFNPSSRKNESWKDKLVEYLRSRNKPIITNSIPSTLSVPCRYDYRAADGTYLYSKVRIEADCNGGTHEKTLRYGIMDFDKDFFKITSKNNLPNVLYNLPTLMDEKRADEPVFITEGEKDCQTLIKAGYIATTAGGANSWSADFAKCLQRRDVVVLGDNDKAGRDLVDEIAKDVLPVAHSLKALFPSKLDKGDVTDYLTVEGGTIDSLMQMVAAEPDQKQVVTAICENDNGDLSERLKRGDKGKPLKCLENMVLVLREDRNIKGRIRYNALAGRPQLHGFKWEMDEHLIKDTDLQNLRLYTSDKYGLSNKNDLLDGIGIVAYENSFHPIVDVLETLKWDGVPRIHNLFSKYLGAQPSEYTTAVTLIMLHGAIQRVYNAGIKYDSCVILADRQQGGGKSTLVRMLALNDDWFTDSLRDLGDDKRCFETMMGHWICELSELVSVRRTKDVESVKAFISRTSDVYRIPYGVYANGFPRQQIFIGTTNQIEFLPSDPSGNRRFLPIICDKTKAEVHPLKDEAETREYIRQCYAEAIAIGKEKGWTLTLPYDLMHELEQIQAQASPEDSKVGMIEKWLDGTSENVVCTRMIYDSIFNTDGRNQPTKYELQDISEIMNYKIKGWHKCDRYRFKGYGQQRAWERDKDETARFKDIDESDSPFT